MNWLLSDFPMDECSITAIISAFLKAKMTHCVPSRMHNLNNATLQLTSLYECYLIFAILNCLLASAAVSGKSKIATFQVQNVFVTGSCKR